MLLNVDTSSQVFTKVQELMVWRTKTPISHHGVHDRFLRLSVINSFVLKNVHLHHKYIS